MHWRRTHFAAHKPMICMWINLLTYSHINYTFYSKQMNWAWNWLIYYACTHACTDTRMNEMAINLRFHECIFLFSFWTHFVAYCIDIYWDEYELIDTIQWSNIFAMFYDFPLEFDSYFQNFTKNLLGHRYFWLKIDASIVFTLIASLFLHSFFFCSISRAIFYWLLTHTSISYCVKPFLALANTNFLLLPQFRVWSRGWAIHGIHARISGVMTNRPSERCASVRWQLANIK